MVRFSILTLLQPEISSHSLVQVYVNELNEEPNGSIFKHCSIYLFFSLCRYVYDSLWVWADTFETGKRSFLFCYLSLINALLYPWRQAKAVNIKNTNPSTCWKIPLFTLLFLSSAKAAKLIFYGSKWCEQYFRFSFVAGLALAHVPPLLLRFSCTVAPPTIRKSCTNSTNAG